MQTGPMTILIVDDESSARRVLREELETMNDVSVLGEAQDGREAVQQIERLRPELVLLDLQMPAMGGFEVVRQLKGDRIPILVITTAYDEYALQSFDAGAVDYLLKPIGGDRLRKSIERAQSLRNHPAQIAEEITKIVEADHAHSGGVTRKVVGRFGSEYFLLDLDEILAFQAEGELVWIVTAKRRLLASQTLGTIEIRLKDQPFKRVHRNAIVNLNHVKKMGVMSSQRWLVTLSNSLQVVVSKRLAHNIRDILSW